MRAVNTALQGLSELVGSGWKATAERSKAGKATTASTHATTAATQLANLRKACPVDVGIERAALSVIAKLCTLEMYDAAYPALCEMHKSLCTLIDVQSPSDTVYLITLPIPAVPPTDTTLLTLLSSYLLHAVTIVAHASRRVPSATQIADVLSNEHTLMSWLPLFSNLPQKHLDFLLTRTYSTLTKSITSESDPRAIYHIRMHALCLLTNTSPGRLSADAFWDLPMRYANAYLKALLSSPSTSSSHPEAARMIVQTFSQIVALVEASPHQESFMNSRPFDGFCDYWMETIKRTGDLSLLDQVTELTRRKNVTDTGAPPDSAFNAADLQALVIKTISLLDGNRVADVPLHGLLGSLRGLKEHLSSGQSSGSSCEKTIERLRRALLQAAESKGIPVDSIAPVLYVIVDVFELLISKDPHSRLISKALDTLFTLARLQLRPSVTSTHLVSHDTLSRCAKVIAGCQDTIGQHEYANFLRCISSSFHNTGGQLYQTNSYASAVTFIEEGCKLGAQALNLHRTHPNPDETSTSWDQLRDQLYRRWQLLGLCNAAINDRRAAYSAFLEAIKAFPYSQFDLAQSDPSSFFSTPSLKELRAIVDKATYQALCELYIPPRQVSLRRVHGDANVTGALLQRQIDFLVPLAHKSTVRDALPQFVRDAVDLCATPKRALHRVRLLLKALSITYVLGPEVLAQVGSTEGIWQQIDSGLNEAESHLTDANATHLQQFRAMAHMWRALHIHRNASDIALAVIEQNAAQACEILRAVVRPPPPPTVAATRSTRGRAPPGRTTKRVLKPKPVPAKAAVTPRSKPRKALQDVPLNTGSIGQADEVLFARRTLFDQPDELLELLENLAHVLGFVGLRVLKLHVLEVVRLVAGAVDGPQCDRYVIASAQLAAELESLGKIKMARELLRGILPQVKADATSPDAAVAFYLRAAANAVAGGDFDQGISISFYEEAVTLSGQWQEDKTQSPLLRTQIRAKRVGQVALAHNVFSLLQASRGDAAASLDGLLQSLRFWNRAYDTLARLQPQQTPRTSDEDDPFSDSPQKNATPGVMEPSQPKPAYAKRPWMDNAGWRIAHGLLGALFALSRVYRLNGAAREAIFFAQQAEELAGAVNAPAAAVYALTRKAEVQFEQGLVEEAYQSIGQAIRVLGGIDAVEMLELQRLKGQYEEELEEASETFEDASDMLQRLNDAMAGFAETLASLRIKGVEAELPIANAARRILHDQVWRLRDVDNSDFDGILEKLMGLPATAETQMEENVLVAKLTLGAIYKRFRSDMFLSSLPESTIALPLDTTDCQTTALSGSTSDVLENLNSTEQLLWNTLQLGSVDGNVLNLRDSTTRLALIRAFQASLGQVEKDSPLVVSNLLDATSALTLRREMTDAILHKFQAMPLQDELKFPTFETPVPASAPAKNKAPRARVAHSPEPPSDDEDECQPGSLQEYWESVRDRYQDRVLDLPTLSESRVSTLPAHWSVVHIAIAADKGTLFITRQYGGGGNERDLAFTIPLKGRRDSEEDEHLTFQDVLTEFSDIVKSSNDTTKAAINIKSGDDEARLAWWRERGALDTRLKDLLENIEFCWLGAFKTILSRRPGLTPEDLISVRSSFDRAFQRGLQSQNKKTKQKALGHRKAASDYHMPNRVTLDDALMECFSTLHSKNRDEELEDLVYFMLDLYQFHGVPIDIAEIDIDQVVIDLRTALEEHAERLRKRAGRSRGATPEKDDEHLFLALDKDLQGLPWENIPILRGRSVSRVPSVDFLLDRMEFARWQQGKRDVDRAKVDPKHGFYFLNPSGDLGRTEDRFKGWAKDVERAGWQGITGKAPSELQFLNALENNDLVVYFGHGGGEQYVRSHKIRHLPRCAAVMLWGCSSGHLRDMGNFDRTGSPYNYMVAGCPSLVANLWDVTDRDIDKFSQAVFDKMHLDGEHVRRWTEDGENSTSVVEAVAQSRDVCKLKYLTGAAPVVYGIPFYL
ncbi:hypothetical protein CYLTODRAFT_358669 [Cylindrobasidium torrendii FP15055 ss-10]|uniref:separase n=1 Tax=Cylindrobasidium torrendii FP15055 ss-10 TaxID=1314674 RepID=A0A0D7B0V6_9AGAR|nr:hypothetical protein CYLTODRAFT_358669 [Cylindrobasidium torrendii FP15055 ss-10]